jgi:hypothetical protein
MTRALRTVAGSKKRLTLLGAVIVALASAIVAVAYFTSSGTGTGTASTGTLSAPTFTDSTAGAGTVSLSWTTVSPPSGSDTVKYYIQRDGGNAGGDCATLSSPTTATSCTDSGLSAGTYHYTVTAVWRSWTATGASPVVTVASGAATKLVITTSPQTLTAGVVSGTITVQRQDAASLPTTSGSTTVDLSSTSAAGAFRDDATGLSTITNVTIPNGSSSASFKYRDTLAGTPTITTADHAAVLTSATQQETVNAANGSKLVFLTSPQTLTAGVASGTITVERQDQFNNPASDGSLTVDLSTTSTGGAFRNTADTSTITSVSIAGGASDASFKYKDTVAGNGTTTTQSTPTITAADHAAFLTSATQQETVNAAGANKLAITSAPFTTTASNAATQAFTVTLRDQFDNATTSASTTTVNLSSSSAGAKFASSSGGVSVSSLSLPANTTQVTAFYADTVAGNGTTTTQSTPTITAAGSGLTSGTQQETINAASPNKLAITSTAFTTSASNSATNAFTVTLRDQFDNATTSGSPTVVNLASTSAGAIFAATSGGAGTTSVMLLANTTQVSAFYGDTVAGNGTTTTQSTPIITTSATLLTSATQQETVNAAAANKLAITSGAFTITASNSATQAFTVTLRDQFNNATTTGSATTVNLGSTSAGARFAATSGGTSVPSVSLPANSTQVTAFYADTVAGNGTTTTQSTPTITASATSLTSGTQQETVNAAGPNKLAITSTAFAVTASNTATQAFTVTLRDAFDNATTSALATTVNLQSSSSGAKFAATSGGSSVLSVSLPANGTQVTAFYADTVAGNGTTTTQSTPTITASATLLTSGTQQETVNAAAANKLTITSSAFTSAASNSATNAFTVTQRDAFDNATTSATPTTVNLSSTSAGKIFAATSGGTSVTSVTLPASSTQVTAFYGDTVAGTPTITAAASGLTSGTQQETITPASAAKLAFTQSPSSGSADNNLSPQPKVTVQDQFGNTVTGDSSTVTLAIKAGTPTSGGPGSLTGCSQTETSGVVTFTGCAIRTAGTGYQVHATDGSLTAADSTAFDITVGAATQLVFSTQPVDSPANATFTPSPQVSVEDAWGNVETGDTTTTVTVAIGTNPNSGTLSGTATKTVSAGVATFSDLTINNAGTGYTLTATSNPAHGTATSNSFNITAGRPIWVATGATQTWTNNSAKTVALPTGIQFGDLLVLIVSNTNAGNTSAAPTSPTSWTTIAQTANTAGQQMNLSTFYRFYQPSDTTGPSVTVNADAGGGSARIVAYRYVNTTTPLDGVAPVATTSPDATTNFTPTGLTTNSAFDRAVSILAENDDGNATNTAPSITMSNAQAFTTETGFPDTVGNLGNAGNRHAADVTSKGITTPGAVTFPTYTTSDAGVWTAVSFALKPVTAPTITSVTPAAGPATGGTSVTIAGTGLLGVTSVKFGATAASTFTVNSDSSITATAPVHAAGTVDVTVSTPSGGTSATSTNDQFTYDTTPTITSVAPSAGKAAGGESVTITGTGFLTTVAATGVKFGGTNATSFTVNSDTQITATTPAHAAGLVDVTVQNTTGTSANTANDNFTYDTTPTVTSLSPNSGATAGGTSVTITGTGFLTATSVKFGVTNATSFTATSDTSITATAPAGSGAVDVTVTNTTGTSALSANGIYSYTPLAAPTVTSISPSSGVATGGTSVTITGTNFTAASTVKFGATAATSATVNNSTSITATSPAGTGTVDVTVTTGGGTSATGAADQFIYIPVVSALGTASTYVAGATSFTTTNTYGPAASGSIVLVLVILHEQSGSPTVSVSGGPTTGSFTSISSKVIQSGAGDATIMQAFWAVGANTNAAFTVTGNAAINGAVVQVVQVVGANTSSPIAATATPGGGSSASASVTFPSPSTGDAQLMVVGVGKGAAITTTPPGSFTELQDTTASNAGNTVNEEASWTSAPAGGSVTAPLSGSDTWGTLGIELKHS